MPVRTSDKSNSSANGVSGGRVAAIRGDDVGLGRLDGMIGRANGAVRHDDEVIRHVNGAVRRINGTMRRFNKAMRQDAEVTRQVDFFHGSHPNPHFYA